MKKLFLLLTALLCLAVTSVAQTMSVKGIVVDGSTQEPLAGATVLPLGGGQGTATDIDGAFQLTVPANVKQLQVSYVGYKTVKVPVQPQINVSLEADNQLDDVVVVGYSQKKAGSIVGAVSVVGSETFQNIPTATFVDALQGQVSGLNISSASGDPSATETSVRLRGVNSLTAGNTPLFILDGAPVTSSVFTTLNPNDIESVTVLKDAASISIYGSRAANGVIVITSKKGKFGENARVSVRANYGWSQMVPDKVDMMSSKEYVQYRDLIGQPVNDEIRRAVDVYGINTDWRKETFNSSAPTYSLEAAISGGSENLSYYVSLNHYESDGIIAQSHLRRETLRFSLNTRVTNWFRFGLQSNLGYRKSQQNSESNAIYDGDGIYRSNPMFFARTVFPFDSPYYYTIGEDGMPVYGERAKYLHFSDAITPQAVYETRSPSQSNVTANVTLMEQITPIKGLVLRAQQNVDAFDYRYEGYSWPLDVIETPMGDRYDWDGQLTGRVSESFQRYTAFTYTNTAEYNHLFGDKHDFTVLLGQEAIITKSNQFGVSSNGHTDIRQMLLTQGIEVAMRNLSQSITKSAFNSYFANVSYNYDSKYFVEGTIRRDGSSKFAPGHRWSTFYSFGAMWNAKAEAFLNQYTWLDDLRVHASYGTTGNSSISNYMYQGLVGSTSVAYNGHGGMGVAQAENKDLTWETVRSFDLGINFGFLKTISGEINFYNKETVDMLMTIPYSYTTGYGAGFGNIGNMRNTGVDLDLRFDIIKNRDWYWAIRANFNYNHNEITKLFDGQDTYTIPNTGQQYKVGHSAGEFFEVRWAGIDPRDGQQMWYDRDGNLTKVFNEEEDAVLVNKSLYAPYSGGFGTDLRWKGLSLKVDFNWAAKKYMINNDRYFIENNNMAMDRNQMTSMLNVWTTPGQVTDIPAADGQVLQFDTHLLENATYLRLKTLTLQYNLPQSILNTLRVSNIGIHFTGRNLFTITDYTGYDPEPESNVVAFFYPNTRQYEFGIEVSF